MIKFGRRLLPKICTNKLNDSVRLVQAVSSNHYPMSLTSFTLLNSAVKFSMSTHAVHHKNSLKSTYEGPGFYI